jgi:hypothetical protein
VTVSSCGNALVLTAAPAHTGGMETSWLLPRANKNTVADAVVEPLETVRFTRHVRRRALSAQQVGFFPARRTVLRSDRRVRYSHRLFMWCPSSMRNVEYSGQTSSEHTLRALRRMCGRIRRAPYPLFPSRRGCSSRRGLAIDERVEAKSAQGGRKGRTCILWLARVVVGVAVGARAQMPGRSRSDITRPAQNRARRIS